MKTILAALALVLAAFAVFAQQAGSTIIFGNAGATGARPAVTGMAKNKTYQAYGSTQSGTGTAVVSVQGSINGGVTFDTIGTISLTLGTVTVSDSFTSIDRYPLIRGNVTTLTGTGPNVSLVMGD